MAEPGSTSLQTAAPARRQSLARRLWAALLLALAGLAITCMLAVAALALWSSTEGSLAQTVRWAQRISQFQPERFGTIEARLDGARGSLRAGGTIPQLIWRHESLTVEMAEVTLEWPDLASQLWTGRGLRIGRLQLASLTVEDRRATDEQPREALTGAELPWPMELTFDVGQFRLTGNTRLEINAIRGSYRYQSERHQLEINHLEVARGQYQVQASLEALAPMTIHARITGQLDVESRAPVTALSLSAQVDLDGTLAGPDARLQLRAQARPADAALGRSANLEATADIRPWQPHPLHAAQVRLRQLDVSAFWPGAPRTLLSGQLDASPAAPGSGNDWRAEVLLSNGEAGPWDVNRVPSDRLSARITRGTEGRWELASIDAAVGGGRLTGRGQFLWTNSPSGRTGPNNWAGELQWNGLNPRALHSRWPEQRLNLSANAENRAGTSVLSLRASGQPRGSQPTLLDVLEVRAQWQAPRLRLLSAEWRALDARLTAQGVVDTGARAFEGRLDASWPGGQIAWDGQLSTLASQAKVSLDLSDSTRTRHWLIRALSTVGQPVPALVQDSNIRGPARLALEWSGNWQASQNWLQRPWQTPPFRLLADLSSPSLELQRDTAAGVKTWTALDTQIKLEHQSGQWNLISQGRWHHGNLSGRLDTHAGARHTDNTLLLEIAQLKANLQLSDNPPALASWDLQAPDPLQLRWNAGGWHWTPGRLTLSPRGAAKPLARLSPATSSGPDALELRWSRLQGGGTHALMSDGHLSGLPLAWLNDWPVSDANTGETGMLQRAGLTTDLLFDAQWAINWPGGPSGSADPPLAQIRLERRSGDLRWQPDTPVLNGLSTPSALEAGIRKASVVVGVQGARIQADLSWDSERAGQMTARLASRLEHSSAGSIWPADAELSGVVEARLPQVGVWSVLAPPGWRVTGAVQSRLEIGGTRSDPKLVGELRAADLSVRSDVQGVALANGRLLAKLDGERVRIEQFVLEGSGGAASGGKLEATGTAEWPTLQRNGTSRREPQIEMRARVQTLRASTRADRRITLSGDVRALLNGDTLSIDGDLKTDQALFVLPDEMAPVLGEDVRVRGRQRPAPGEGTTRRVVPQVNIRLNLGEHFEVRGQGLQARLSGQLDLRSTAAQPTPRILGEVRTLSGSYRAYGQRLDIEQGVLRFAGPYDNPALDVLAIRPFTSQRVGVQIRGTARAPQIRLYAEPELPDNEKLAWLVLGRPASGGGAEAAVLQQAALALLSNGSGPTLGETLGLDELSLRSASNGDTTSAAITLGKRLSSQLYVSYERTLAGTLGTFAIFYDISRRLTLRASAGEDNALDLLFTLSYD